MIWIAQLLCPGRHCVIAVAFEHKNELPKVKAAAEANFSAGKLNRRCGICGATRLDWESGRTKFRTLKEARAELERLNALDLLTRSILDSAGLTYDRKLQN